MDQQGGRIRASDSEREQYAEVLRTAMGEGRLQLAEGEERLGKVYAAVYRDELDPLTADLPGGGWWALYDTPEIRARMRRLVRWRVGTLALVVGLVLAAGLVFHQFPWPVLLLAFFTLVVVRRAGWRRHWRAGGWGPPWPGPRGPHGHWHDRGYEQWGDRRRRTAA